MFSTLMILFVVVQAVRLDATRPWFEGPPKDPHGKHAAPRGRGGQLGVPWRERRR